MTVLLGLMAVIACEDSHTATAGTVDQETFIAAYVDLRVTALGTEVGELDETLRAEVLERNGVSEADLLNFIEAHGEDVALMQSVWDEIELRLDGARPPADSVPQG